MSNIKVFPMAKLPGMAVRAKKQNSRRLDSLNNDCLNIDRLNNDSLNIVLR